jgi:serine phosphatase RsbU (regulator of sigma subunit)
MFKQNLKLKILIANLIILTVITVLYLMATKILDLPYQELYPYISLILFLGAEMIYLNVEIHKPLKKILGEMKSLLVGKNFKKIYTLRTDEIGIIGHFFNKITDSLETISNDLKEHKRITGELNLAQKIQQDLIPKEAPYIPGLEITAKTKPAAEIGGDTFDFLPQENQTYFYIGDVSGHGIPSGLVMIMVDSLITTLSTICKTTKELVISINKFLKPRLQTNMFMTMVMFRWEHLTRKLFYTGSGHERIIHYKKSEGKCTAMVSGGIALGMLPDISKIAKDDTEIDFQEGDFIILYSDGITECKNSKEEFFGIKRVIETIEEKANEAQTTKELFDYIARKITVFVENEIQADDMSLLVIKNVGMQDTKTIQKEPTSWKE